MNKSMTFAERILRAIDKMNGATYTEICSIIRCLRNPEHIYNYKNDRGIAGQYMGMIKNFARKDAKTKKYIIWKEIEGPFYTSKQQMRRNCLADKLAFERTAGNIVKEIKSTPIVIKDNKLSLSQLVDVLNTARGWRNEFGWREGQCLFNAIAKDYPELGNEIRGNINMDPFYKDINIKACINFILK